ncbi:MAG: hypothetical protein JWP37_3511 [Mucilaginibacter sp.]|nr:hypothetical protein [Mucilaginibacter sp.]
MKTINRSAQQLVNIVKQFNNVKLTTKPQCNFCYR